MLKYMRRKHFTTIDPTPEAESAWREHVNDVATKGLFAEAKSWYFGDNIPGKPREALNYMAGLPLYKDKIWSSSRSGYEGFVLG